MLQHMWRQITWGPLDAMVVGPAAGYGDAQLVIGTGWR
jgi:hypothetical protein